MKNNYISQGRILLFSTFCLILTPFFTVALTTHNVLHNYLPDHVIVQQSEISGTITDALGNPIAGIHVMVEGTNQGVVSNFDGTYIITANPNDTLIVSAIGFITQTIPVNNTSVINIQLQEDITQLDAVTLNAGYYTVLEKERTGSIAYLSSSNIEKQPVSNLLATMQGQLSGVFIKQSNGTPGGAIDIKIRGINSLRTEGNEPLYIIDGVPFSSQSLGDIQLSGGILAGTVSPLNTINPNDIESIEILKDADATAIYGSRGANGVVLITSKKGKKGKTKFSINTYTSAGKLTRKIDLMNTEQYLSMRREAFKNDNIETLPFFAYDVNGTWDQNRYTDWQKEFLGGTAWITNTQATLSGGSNTTQFLVSGSYRKETTVFKNDTYYGKANVLSNLNHQSENGKFKLNLSVSYASDKNTLMATDLTYQAVTLAPNAPALYDEEENLNWENNTFENPLAALDAQYEARNKNLLANTLLSYKLLPNLTAKLSMGYTDTQLNEVRTIPSTVYNPAFGLGSEFSILFLSHGKRNSWIMEPQLDWNLSWKKHQLNTLLGSSFQSQNSERLSQLGMGFSSNELLRSLGAATTLFVTANEKTQYNYQAIFARLNYIFDDKLILNLTGRRDGSSRFGPGKRFANFGAIGAAWVFSKEAFIQKGLPFLSFGKLRGSYGVTGNDQIGDYQYLDTYSISGNQYNGVIGLQPNRLFNPNFGWESNNKLELATELGLFQDRFFVTAAWYQNRSSNQLVGIPLPATTGFSTLQANLNATVENSGWEFDIRTVNLSNNSFKWISSLNLSIPKNKLLAFDGLESSTYANSYVIGEPITIDKVYEFTGIDPDTGVYTFKDFDEDGVVTNPNDKQFIANRSPEFFGGLNNTFNYKNWSFDFLFQFVKQQGRNYLYGLNLAGGMSNMPTEVLNHWPNSGTTADIQRYTTGANSDALNAYFRYGSSSATISDASYIRLRNINLSYSFPIEKTGVCSGKIYLQGQNLLTITNYKGADPEAQLLSYIPPLKQYALGIQLNF
tara:strand:- start:86 stop:3136 length:3051 start_codon:yes stop_codon:yes gene_type:complete